MKSANPRVLWIFGGLFASLFCGTVVYGSLRIECNVTYISGLKSPYRYVKIPAGYVASLPRQYITLNGRFGADIPTCKDIIYDGRIEHNANNTFMYKYYLVNEKDSGFDCEEIGLYKKTDCYSYYLMESQGLGLNCTRSRKPLAKLKFDIRTIDKLLTYWYPIAESLTFSWDPELETIKIDCLAIYLDVYDDDRFSTDFIMPFLWIEKSVHSDVNMKCSNFIWDKVYISVDGAVMYYISNDLNGYECDTGEIYRGNETEYGFQILTFVPYLLCREKNVRKQNEIPQVGSISCPFRKYIKMTDKYHAYNATEIYFILVKNISYAKCSDIIIGNVKNYDDTFLDFILYKKEISGFECDVKASDIARNHSDSYEYVTDIKGLTCWRWNDYIRPPLLSKEPRTIDCVFRKFIPNYICHDEIYETHPFIYVTTDESLQCYSFIWRDEVQVQYEYNETGPMVESYNFFLNKKNVKGYDCFLEPYEIKKESTTLYYVEKKEPHLECTKIEDGSFTLECNFNDVQTINGSTTTIQEYVAPFITVYPSTKDTCEEIIVSGRIVKEESGLATFQLYKESISNYTCFLNDGDVENEFGEYLSIKTNLTQLRCNKSLLSDPYNSTDVDDQLFPEVEEDGKVQAELESEDNSVVGKDGEVEAELESEDNSVLGIDGEVQAELESEDNSVVGKDGEVEAELESEDNSVVGKDGEVQAELESEDNSVVGKDGEVEAELESEDNSVLGINDFVY